MKYLGEPQCGGLPTALCWGLSLHLSRKQMDSLVGEASSRTGGGPPHQLDTHPFYIIIFVCLFCFVYFFRVDVHHYRVRGNFHFRIKLTSTNHHPLPRRTTPPVGFFFFFFFFICSHFFYYYYWTRIITRASQ